MKRVFRHIWHSFVFYLINHLFEGTNPLFFAVKRWLLRSVGCVVGDNTSILGPIYCSGHLVFGRNCWVGANLVVRGNGTVIIGDNVDIGPDVTFLTGTHHIGGVERRAGRGYSCTIMVGDGCWIGARSTFLNEIDIGNSTVIAAASCVCKNVPKNVIVGGVPAKVIRGLGDGTIQ